MRRLICAVLVAAGLLLTAGCGSDRPGYSHTFETGTTGTYAPSRVPSDLVVDGFRAGRVIETVTEKAGYSVHNTTGRVIFPKGPRQLSPGVYIVEGRSSSTPGQWYSCSQWCPNASSPYAIRSGLVLAGEGDLLSVNNDVDLIVLQDVVVREIATQ
ncbi:hypothetical protein SEA_SPEEDDEMON_1330 [Gordonia phage SpeedDemon]|nr:hypothetical protein SEA_SPEEDDEMON_1330 [Gordonia phage SpeedDemon]